MYVSIYTCRPYHSYYQFFFKRESLTKFSWAANDLIDTYAFVWCSAGCLIFQIHFFIYSSISVQSFERVKLLLMHLAQA